MCRSKNAERIRQFAERFELTEALSSPMMSYSHGMRQKIMVVAALMHNPPVWILDEPMVGLDPKSAFELKQMMREHAQAGNTVFSRPMYWKLQKNCVTRSSSSKKDISCLTEHWSS